MAINLRTFCEVRTKADLVCDAHPTKTIVLMVDGTKASGVLSGNFSLMNDRVDRILPYS